MVGIKICMALTAFALNALVIRCFDEEVELVQIPSSILFLLVNKQTQSNRLNKGV